MAESITSEEIRDFLSLGVDHATMVRRFEQMEPGKIAVLLAHLGSTGTTGATLEAVRDAGQAIIDQKLTDRLVSTLDKLDRSARWLSIVGILLSTIIGIAGILIPLLAHKS
jgi:hypothetical protein